MDISHVYPELRRHLSRYDVDDVVERLEELLAYGESIVVTDTGCGPWVLLPSHVYDNLVSVFVACNNLIETRRQAAEPLPPL
jgi:hypothetical protein